MKRPKKIGVLSGGGDCPGINAVIRAVAKKAMVEHRLDVVGILDGYDGLIRRKFRTLELPDVSGILTLGGTILGASKVSNPYQYAVGKGVAQKFHDVSARAIATFRDLGLDGLVCIGGDGTLGIAWRLCQSGVPIVGVPKTIDNDLRGTEMTFGFDTASTTAAEAVDRLHSTAQAHQRIMVLEVMGHRAGWIALQAGVAGGGDIILIPEIPYSIEAIVKKVRDRDRSGKRFSIVVVAEGAKPVGGDVVVRKVVAKASDPVRLGGIGFALADRLEILTGHETRVVVLGHLQRGGSPTPHDRVLATRLGAKAVDLIMGGEFGKMSAVCGGEITSAPLEVAAGGPRLVPLDHPLIAAARSLGTSFGDEI
jgi:6-phosphofructokinase 1